MQYRPLDSLKKHPKNPRTIKDESFRKLVQSIDQNPDYFEARPIILSDRTGDLIIIAGNQRYAAAKEIGIKDVPTVLIPALTEEKEQEIMIRDNISNGDWDYDMLAADWDSSDLQEWGLDMPDWSVEEDKNLSDTDEIPEIEEEAVTRIGDIWILGDNRVICGDSSVLSIEYSNLFFDPPWNIDYPKIECENILAFTDCQRASDIIGIYQSPSWIFIWDCVSSWYTPNRPLKRAKLALWYGDISNYDFNGSHYGDAGEARTVFNTRGSYEFKPDSRGKHLSDVFNQPITQLHKDSQHSHSKPIDWVRMLIANCFPDGIVYDPYAGSGTCLIACEQLNRPCISVELSPQYVDVIVKRWQEFTGKEAVLESTCKTFDEMIGERNGA